MLLLNAIAEVESNNRPVAGDHGAALSRYQIHEAVWQDAKIRFDKQHTETFGDVGEKFADIGGADPVSESRAYHTAVIHVATIEEALQQHGQPCTAENIYCCWNLGVEGFARRHWNMAECPLQTMVNARRVEELARVRHPWDREETK